MFPPNLTQESEAMFGPLPTKEAREAEPAPAAIEVGLDGTLSLATTEDTTMPPKVGLEISAAHLSAPNNQPPTQKKKFPTTPPTQSMASISMNIKLCEKVDYQVSLIYKKFANIFLAVYGFVAVD